jgi:hypothetical protein
MRLRRRLLSKQIFSMMGSNKDGRRIFVIPAEVKSLLVMADTAISLSTRIEEAKESTVYIIRG